jgi:type IV pilus assembly protein PilM
MAQAELKESLPFQVQDFLPMPVEQAVLDFFPLEELADGGSRFYRGLLVAAARETVLANVRCAEKSGLTVTAVDLSAFAVLRSMGRQTAMDVETEALVDIGARVTNVIVHSGGVPRFVRILLNGGQDVTDAVAERLGISNSEAEGLKQRPEGISSSEQLAAVNRALTTTAQDFVDGIRGSLDYYAASYPGAPVERILVSGGGSRLNGLVERLTSALRLPVLAGDPLGTVRIGKTGLNEDQLEFVKPLSAVPVGLALGAF